MKKIAFLVASVLAVVLLLSACGGGDTLNGAYKSDEGILSQTWTFSGSNKITLSAGGGLIGTEGTYEISGGDMIVTSSLFGVETVTNYSFQRDGKNIIIEGTVFYKQ
ncbi:MAG: hypothetical protein LBD85_04030 [Oscillospiraceae bacterium]|nr:hypothetical protein [Oscillospiraceae bacterium]